VPLPLSCVKGCDQALATPSHRYSAQHRCSAWRGILAISCRRPGDSLSERRLYRFSDGSYRHKPIGYYAVMWQ